MKKKPPTKLEVIFWNIALPGMGQLLNGKIVKGILFILLEVVINVRSNFNLAILYSFNGEISRAMEVTNYQWLMFYPCLYLFALWDGYRDADGEIAPLAFMPFVFGAFFVTIGLMYSSKIKIMGVLIGPVFLPILFLIPGIMIGFIIKKTMIKMGYKTVSNTFD